MSDENKIPTAEEFMLINIPSGIQNIKGKGDGKPQYKAEKDIIQFCMMEFAKLHVRKALEKAHKNMQLPEEDLEFTLNSYPETNIK